ncbi:zinc-dependent metalloprotease [Roseofilum sp. BLCC_M154]|uniref:Zinc-dependent metalloprotease n=1 Tax=Roseofilum acuticapitatum BLCC-M154 TaxID=3022444 RepID=A0ABT7AXR0_9CYAN|nr:zinc-dependent metalloprotease [Roseofilum acuticapitatum]MDJ1171670.1 zinc-dependent metalloprotease [Roseofilum acuticapitatum BLCC-M154]
MKKLYLIACLILGFLAVTIWPSWGTIVDLPVTPVVDVSQTLQDWVKSEESSESKSPKSFEDLISGTQKQDGLFTLYKTEDKENIYLEIAPEQLNRNFLCVMTLSSGIGEGFLLNGMPIGEVLFQLRKVQDRVQFVVPQTNFRTDPGDPLARSLNEGFSDSVLYSLKIEGIHPERKSLLIDATDLVMGEGDLSGLSTFLPYLLNGAYSVSADNSYITEVENFPENLEIEALYGFSGGGFISLPSLPDSRAFNLAVHYSFSSLPNHDYRPRLADERIGYFVTAYKNFSNSDRRDPFVRYINRWNIEPGKPLVFWIENTVPLEYREAVKEGILMWNEAFAQAGLPQAIEVRQMPDNADWTPADIRYNVVRWSSSFEPMFYGIGPSRTNPLTGEILDADILIDANVVRLIKGQYQTLVNPDAGGGQQQSLLQTFCQDTLENSYLRGVDLSEESEAKKDRLSGFPLANSLLDRDVCFAKEFNRQLAIGATSLSLTQNVLPSSTEMEDYVQQFIRFLVAHEVGHTLGLRHNFHGSTLLSPEELQNPEITRTLGMVGSVMDYVSPNLAPPGKPQGDYFSTKLGPYDIWAIEYGYKPLNAVSPEAELRELRQIAQRAAEPELAYGTDEDYISRLDPAVNTFDLSNDPLTYAQWQLENAQAMWSRLNRRSPAPGESFSEMRDLFDTVFFYYFRNAMNLTLYVGGQSFNRHYAGDPNGGLPFQPLAAEEQRAALGAINQYVFSADAFQFSPHLLNQLAPSRWSHWGAFPDLFELDYPISDRLLFLQQVVLRSLLSPTRLSRLQDLELKTDSTEEVFRLPELFSTLQESVWTEVKDGDIANLSSIRRALQREYVEVLSRMSLRQVRVPEDAVTLAWYNLRELEDQIDRTLRRQGRGLDTYTKAHLEKTRDRIAKVLDAPLESKSMIK